MINSSTDAEYSGSQLDNVGRAHWVMLPAQYTTYELATKSRPWRNVFLHRCYARRFYRTPDQIPIV